MSEMSSLYSTHSHLELDVTSWRTLGVSWHGHSNDHYHRSPNSSSVPGCDSNLLNYVCYLTQSLGHFCNGDVLTTMPHWQTLGYLAREDSYFRPPMRWGVVCRLKSWTSDLNCPPPFFSQLIHSTKGVWLQSLLGVSLHQLHFYCCIITYFPLCR